MKLSIVISTQPSSFTALTYTGKLAENLHKIKNLGYDGAELAVRNPQQLDISVLQSLLQKNELPVPAIGTGQAYGEEGLSFVHPDSTIRHQAIERIKSHIDLAHQLGSIVIIGLVRGKMEPDTDTNTAENLLIQACRECASVNENVKLAIEPINRYETDIINTVKSGLEIINKIEKENVGLLLDTFHMNIEEPSITESIISARDRLFHFHIADSNRWYPGAGHINFSEIMNTLDKINYQGFVSAEILPVPDPDTAAEETIYNMKTPK